MENRELWPGWETLRVIGSGGCGKVYEICPAGDPDGTHCALKVISIPASPDEYAFYRDDNYSEESISDIFRSQKDSMLSEYELLAQFRDSACIVRYEDHMVKPHEDGIGWDIMIRMELLTSLPAYCKENSMGPRQIRKLARDICRALVLCEKKHVIHRDIKPQNIFINDQGDFKLGDFGIAKYMDHTTRATKTGTYHYMAPEVYKGQPYNATVDTYALGLVLYWLLNERRLPFLPVDRAPTAGELNRAQERRMNGEPFPAPEHTDPLLLEVIRKACAYDPAQRYRSARDMLEALCRRPGEAPKRAAAPEEEKTEGIWGSTPRPRPQEPNHVCIRCGKPVPKGVRQCDDCIRLQEAERKAREYAPCPQCQGRKVQTFLDNGGFTAKYYEDTCSVCKGTGTIKRDEAGEYILKQYREARKMMREKGNVSDDCPICHGLGQVVAVSKLLPFCGPKLQSWIRCPGCTGKRVKKGTAPR